MPADSLISPAPAAAAPAAGAPPAGTPPAAVPAPGTTPPAGAPAGTPPAAVTPPAGTPPAPKPLELKLPEKAAIDAEDLADLTKFATEKGLSQEHASALVERENARTAELLEALPGLVNERATAMAAEQAKAWLAECQADAEFGGAKLTESAENARRFVEKVGGADAKVIHEILRNSGLGNHPAFLRAFARAGKMLREDSATPTLQGNPPAAKSFEDKLYATA